MAVDQRWSSKKLTIAALATGQVDYDFQPDQIIVLCTSSVLNGFYIFPHGAQGSAGIPLLSQGPVVFPGIEANQHIDFTSLELSSKDLVIIAQKGYQPTSIVTPTTQGLAQTTNPTGQAIFEAKNAAAVWNAGSYNHQGRWALVLVGMHDFGVANPHRTFSSITLGGVAGTLLKRQQQANSTTDWDEVAIFLVDNLVNGPLALVSTLSGIPQQGYMSALVISFRDGIVAGNVGGAGANAGANISFSVTSHNASSLIISLFSGSFSTALPYSETGGATVILAIHITANSQDGMYERSGGPASMQFFYSGAGTAGMTSACSAAAEIYIP